MRIYDTVIAGIFIFLIALASPVIAQSSFGLGLNAGGGTIGGNLPSQGSFNSSLFIEGNPGFKGNINFRLSFIFASDINILLQQSANRYSPFIKGLSLEALTSQTLEGIVYAEEGIGIVTLNDRTFSNVNAWDTGIVFSILPGVDLRNDAQQGFKLGIGAGYGLTFTNTNVWFLSVHLQTEYYF